MPRLICPTVLLLAIAFLGSPGCKKSNRARNDDTGNSNPPPKTNSNSNSGQSDHDPRPKFGSQSQFTNLYGETGGEKTLGADEAPPSAPLRARKADTFYKLSNPRTEPRKANGPFPPRPGAGPLLVIDYERTHERAIDGDLSIVVRSASGKDHVVPLQALKNRGGQIQLEVPTRGPWPGGQLPKDAEFYLIRSEGRYGKDFQKKFKVSNSVMMGESKFPPTQARGWSADEAAKLATRPVEAPKPNVNPNIGQDTVMAGTTNSFRERFAEDRPLLGLDWYEWFWPVAGGKEECLGQVIPIYDRAYPDMGRKRALARPGYAVGAITAKTKTYVNGIQITFMKLTADGKLDPSQSYTTDWLGPYKVGTNETKLGGDGRRVLGLVCHQVGGTAGLGYLSAIGLVMEPK